MPELADTRIRENLTIAQLDQLRLQWKGVMWIHTKLCWDISGYCGTTHFGYEKWRDVARDVHSRAKQRVEVDLA